jgi:hypothetical protein
LHFENGVREEIAHHHVPETDEGVEDATVGRMEENLEVELELNLESF